MRRHAVILDSGIDAGHPALRHGPPLRPGRSFGPVAGRPADRDELGHGTAVAVVVRQQVADAELTSLRLFGDQPVVDFDTVLEALAAALELRPAVVNLSLGTTSLRHRQALADLVGRARGQGCALVAPAAYGGLACDPGSLPGVEAVAGDANVAEVLPELRPHGDRLVWFASPLPPRDQDGIRRLVARGDSLAVARVTAALLQRL